MDIVAAVNVGGIYAQHEFMGSEYNAISYDGNELVRASVTNDDIITNRIKSKK